MNSVDYKKIYWKQETLQQFKYPTQLQRIIVTSMSIFLSFTNHLDNYDLENIIQNLFHPYNIAVEELDLENQNQEFVGIDIFDIISVKNFDQSIRSRLIDGHLDQLKQNKYPLKKLVQVFQSIRQNILSVLFQNCDQNVFTFKIYNQEQTNLLSDNASKQLLTFLESLQYAFFQFDQKCFFEFAKNLYNIIDVKHASLNQPRKILSFIICLFQVIEISIYCFESVVSLVPQSEQQKNKVIIKLQRYLIAGNKSQVTYNSDHFEMNLAFVLENNEKKNNLSSQPNINLAFSEPTWQDFKNEIENRFFEVIYNHQLTQNQEKNHELLNQSIPLKYQCQFSYFNQMNLQKKLAILNNQEYQMELFHTTLIQLYEQQGEGEYFSFDSNSSPHNFSNINIQNQPQQNLNANDQKQIQQQISYILERLPNNTYQLKYINNGGLKSQKKDSFFIFSELYQVPENIFGGAAKVLKFMQQPEFIKLTQRSHLLQKIISDVFIYDEIIKSKIFQKEEMKQMQEQFDTTMYYTIIENFNQQPFQYVTSFEQISIFNILKLRVMQKDFYDKMTSRYRLLDLKESQLLKSARIRIHMASFFEVLVANFCGVLEEKNENNPESIWDIISYLINQHFFYVILDQIIYKNIGKLKNFFQTIKSIYVKFNQIPLQDLSYCPRELDRILHDSDSNFNKVFRFGRTNYYIQNSILIIQLNVAMADVPSNIKLSLSEEFANKNKQQINIESIYKTNILFNNNYLENYFLIITNKFDFFLDIFSIENTISMILNQIKLDKILQELSQQFSKKYSIYINFAFNIQSLNKIFSCLIQGIKQSEKHTEIIQSFKNLNKTWEMVLRIKQYFKYVLTQQINEQFQSSYFDDFFILLLKSQVICDRSQISLAEYFKQSSRINQLTTIKKEDMHDFQFFQMGSELQQQQFCFLLPVELSYFLSKCQVGEYYLVGFYNEVETIQIKEKGLGLIRYQYQNRSLGILDLPLDKIQFALLITEKWPDKNIHCCQFDQILITDNQRRAIEMKQNTHLKLIQYLNGSSEHHKFNQIQQSLFHRNQLEQGSEVSVINLVQHLPQNYQFDFNLIKQKQNHQSNQTLETKHSLLLSEIKSSLNSISIPINIKDDFEKLNKKQRKSNLKDVDFKNFKKLSKYRNDDSDEDEQLEIIVNPIALEKINFATQFENDEKIQSTIDNFKLKLLQIFQDADFYDEETQKLLSPLQIEYIFDHKLNHTENKQIILFLQQYLPYVFEIVLDSLIDIINSFKNDFQIKQICSLFNLKCINEKNSLHFLFCQLFSNYVKKIQFNFNENIEMKPQSLVEISDQTLKCWVLINENNENNNKMNNERVLLSATKQNLIIFMLQYFIQKETQRYQTLYKNILFEEKQYITLQQQQNDFHYISLELQILIILDPQFYVINLITKFYKNTDTLKIKIMYGQENLIKYEKENLLLNFALNNHEPLKIFDYTEILEVFRNYNIVSENKFIINYNSYQFPPIKKYDFDSEFILRIILQKSFQNSFCNYNLVIISRSYEYILDYIQLNTCQPSGDKSDETDFTFQVIQKNWLKPDQYIYFLLNENFEIVSFNFFYIIDQNLANNPLSLSSIQKFQQNKFQFAHLSDQYVFHIKPQPNQIQGFILNDYFINNHKENNENYLINIKFNKSFTYYDKRRVKHDVNQLKLRFQYNQGCFHQNLWMRSCQISLNQNYILFYSNDEDEITIKNKLEGQEFRISYKKFKTLELANTRHAAVAVDQQEEIVIKNQNLKEQNQKESRQSLFYQKFMKHNNLLHQELDILSIKYFIQNESDVEKIQNLLETNNYLSINENQKQILTFCGQQRTDFFEFYDFQKQKIDFLDQNQKQKNFEVIFVHSVFREIAVKATESQIVQNNKLKSLWTPYVKGFYKVYINNVLMDQESVIVIGNDIDLPKTQLEILEKKKIQLFEKKSMTFHFKDKFGNIYSESERMLFRKNKEPEIGLKIIAENVDIENLIILKSTADSNKDQNFIEKQIQFSIELQQSDLDLFNPENLELQIFILGHLYKKIKYVCEGISIEEKIRKFQIEKKKKFPNSDYDKRQIPIRRDILAEDLLKKFAFKDPENPGQDKYLDFPKGIQIFYEGEKGSDMGGLSREFFEEIGQKIIKEPSLQLFQQVQDDKYYFNKNISKNKQSKKYLRILGQLVGLSFRQEYQIGVDFANPFYKILFNEKIGFEDLEFVFDKKEFQQYQFILLSQNAEEIEDLSQQFYIFENKQMVELKENGKDIQLNLANRDEFLSLLANYLLFQKFKVYFDEFRLGFDSVFDLSILKKYFFPSQLYVLTSGKTNVTNEQIGHLLDFEYGNPQINTFVRRYFQEASQTLITGALKFITGNTNIPYDTRNFKLIFSFKPYMSLKDLPQSHTCFLKIDVPFYKSFDVLKNKFDYAFTEATVGFQMA